MRITWEWLAGFWDGEGCFVISRSTKSGRHQSSFLASVAQSGDIGKEVLLAIKEFLGKASVSTCFGNNSSMKKRNAGHQEAWRLGVHGRNNLEKFLPHIIPFLVVKKPLAQDMFRFLKMYPSSRKILAHEFHMKRRARVDFLAPLILSDRKAGLTYKQLIIKYETSSDSVNRVIRGS